jgi:hypothetical protein
VALQSAGSLEVHSGGDMHLRAQGHSHIDGETLNLNCGDRSAYPPPPEGAGTVPGVLPPSLESGSGAESGSPSRGSTPTGGPGGGRGEARGGASGCGCEH